MREIYIIDYTTIIGESSSNFYFKTKKEAKKHLEDNGYVQCKGRYDKDKFKLPNRGAGWCVARIKGIEQMEVEN